MYYKYADKISIKDYIFSKKIGIPRDPEIAFYQRSGLKIIKIIPEYFRDVESLNYGVLVAWENPFYNKWYKHIAANFFKI